MPKTLRNVYDKKLTFENLINAHYRAIAGKRNKVEMLRFEQDMETAIMNIFHDLQNQTYNLGKYREFKIYEPKERVIKSLPFKDRVVHQWYVYEFIKPFYIPRFIKDSYACIDNRGTHKCAKSTQKYMKQMRKKYGKNYYVIKADIKKYFYSINKEILYQILKRNIKDNKLLRLTKILIYDNNDDTSIPIGNYTSQYFANIYLNELDQYIKNILRIKYYLRYMDDFCILLKSKDECKRVLYEIKNFLSTNLKLELNPKTRYYPSKFGVNFCGYVIHEDYMLLRKSCIKKIKKRIKTGTFDLKKYKGHLIHANAYNFISTINKTINTNNII